MSKGIYIHGTADEKCVGKPASYGCVRMRSKDVIALYDLIRIGTRVTISDQSVKRVLPQSGNFLARLNERPPFSLLP